MKSRFYSIFRFTENCCRNCNFTMDNLILQLENAFNKVTAKTCAGLIKKMRDVEDKFWRDDAVLDKKN